MGRNIHVIKYEGDNSELFKKICVDGLDADAKLVVPETHNAILIKDGMAMDTLNSGSYDIFEEKSRRKSKNVSVEVIYMSKTARLKVMWGTRSQFSFRDPETDVPVKLGAHGEFEVQISNPRKAYMVLIGAEKEFTVQDLKERLVMRMLSKTEPAIAREMRAGALSYDRISEHKDEIAAKIMPDLKDMFEDYGLKLFSFMIGNVVISDDDIAAIREARERGRAQVRCLACGQPCGSGAKFCPNCGAALGNKECPACGRQNPADAKFCSDCGKKF